MTADDCMEEAGQCRGQLPGAEAGTRHLWTYLFIVAPNICPSQTYTRATHSPGLVAMHLRRYAALHLLAAHD
jgi:hypothetical protein